MTDGRPLDEAPWHDGWYPPAHRLASPNFGPIHLAASVRLVMVTGGGPVGAGYAPGVQRRVLRLQEEAKAMTTAAGQPG